MWKLTNDNSSEVWEGVVGKFKGVKFYRPKSTGHFWLRDQDNHGGSSFKVHESTSDGLDWLRDADDYGNYIEGKHKGKTGYLIYWNQLRRIK